MKRRYFAFGRQPRKRYVITIICIASLLTCCYDLTENVLLDFTDHPLIQQCPLKTSHVFDDIYELRWIDFFVSSKIKYAWVTQTRFCQDQIIMLITTRCCVDRFRLKVDVFIDFWSLQSTFEHKAHIWI